jgi:hypothetical protein
VSIRGLLLIGMLAGLSSDVVAQCLAYEPEPVELVGRLFQREFPGPPEYHSVELGDQPELASLLLLDATVCVDGDPASDLNLGSHDGLVLVQLVSDQSLLSYEAQRVVVRGSLFERHAAHHRTAVLLTVDEIARALD